MTDACCGPPHPLVRDGTSQAARLAPELQPERTRLDDRGMAELLRWVRRYAEGVNAYDLQDRIAGDMRPFVADDPGVRIALIALTDPNPLAERFRERREAAAAPGAVPERIERFREAAAVIVDVARELEGWRPLAERGLRAGRDVDLAIRAEARPLLQRLRRYDLGAEALDELSGPLGIDYGGLGAHWELDGLTADPGIYQGLTDDLRLDHALVRLESLFRSMHQVYARQIGRAAGWLEETLDGWPRHEAHMALLLAFLLLYRDAQGALNGLVGRHLDFYYQEVLRLVRRPAMPDQAHVLLELARQRRAHVLAQGTLFRAGKDETGVERHYALRDESFFNQAHVSDLKALYVAGDQEQARLYRSPVANSADGRGGEFADPDDRRWRTFGQDDRREPFWPAFVVAAPALWLAEGRRRITLTLTLSEALDPALAAQEVFRAHVSTEEGWHRPSGASVVEVDGARIVIALCLARDEPAVTTPEDPLACDGIETGVPLIKVEAAGEAAPAWYPRLADVEVLDVELEVEAQGARRLLLRSDQGPLAPDQPGLPFGSHPVVGSALLIGSPEGFQKRVIEASLHLRWLDRPTDLVAHYAEYDDAQPDTNEDFTARLRVLDGREPGGWRSFGDPFSLFPEPGLSLHRTGPTGYLVRVRDAPGALATVSVEGGMLEGEATTVSVILDERGEAALTLDLPVDIDSTTDWRVFASIEHAWAESVPLSRAITRPPRAAAVQPGLVVSWPAEDPTVDQTTVQIRGSADDPLTPHPERREAFTSFSSSLPQGFLALELREDFRHGAFPRVYAERAIEKARDPEDNRPLPLAPYTPAVGEVTLDYRALERVAAWSEAHDGTGRFFHLHPFGHAEQTERPTLLPAFRLRRAGPEPDPRLAGALYVGLERLEPPQNLSLLFQVAEGTADVSIAEPPRVEWSVLAGDEWEPLDGAVLADRTRGLIQSGVVRLQVPASATRDHRLLPAGRHWLRAAVRRDPGGVSDLIGVHAQAATVEFQDRGNDPAHTASPLPAGSITRLLEPDAAVAEVVQPYASFGGRVSERDHEYYRRVSERLRHKDRAVSIWDWERLVLERFPEVHKVKCISHAAYEAGDGADDQRARAERAPGAVTVVVIARATNRNDTSRLRPRASRALLTAIEEELRGRVSPAIAEHIAVINPRYERVGTEMRVRLRPGEDEGLRREHLADAVLRYLAPWAYEEAAEIAFGGAVHRSALVNVIERQPYVDAVLDFALFLDDPERTRAVAEASATSARAVLTAERRSRIRHEDAMVLVTP